MLNIELLSRRPLEEGFGKMKEEFTEMEETEFQEMISGMLTDDDDWKYINIIPMYVFQSILENEEKCEDKVINLTCLWTHVCTVLFKK